MGSIVQVVRDTTVVCSEVAFKIGADEARRAYVEAPYMADVLGCLMAEVNLDLDGEAGFTITYVTEFKDQKAIEWAHIRVIER